MKKSLIRRRVRTRVKKKKGKIMKSARHWRQIDIADPAQLAVPVTIVGAGGIGSEVARIMAKVGFSKLEVYDDDFVEEHNLSNQFYRNKDIGKSKVKALSEIIQDFSEEKIKVHDEWYEKQPCGDILITALDSMDTRIRIWEAVKYNRDLKWVIDGRMGGEFFSVNIVDMANPQQKELYQKTLYPSKEAVELPCTAKSIMYNCSMVAAFIAHQAKQICVGQKPVQQIDVDITNTMLYVVR